MMGRRITGRLIAASAADYPSLEPHSAEVSAGSYRRPAAHPGALHGQEYSVVGAGDVKFGATFLAFIVAEQ
jgi:hypothetical protein